MLSLSRLCNKIRPRGPSQLVQYLSNESEMPYTLIFRVDGGLLNVEQSVIAALNCLLETESLVTMSDEEAVAVTKNGAASNAITALFYSRLQGAKDKKELASKIDMFSNVYTKNFIKSSYLSEEFDEMFTALSERGLQSIFVTNFSQKVADAWIENYPILKNNSKAIYGYSQQCPILIPDPGMLLYAVEMGGGDLSRSLFVGSSVADVKAAHSAGLPCIVVTSDKQMKDETLQLHPAIVLESYSELPDALEKLMEKSMY